MEKKTKSEDEDFERMVREFIDTELNDEDSPDDFETSDDLDDQLTDNMPFPKDLNDKVANAMMKANCHDADFLKDVAKVTVEVGPDYDKNVLWDAPLAVTFHPKSKAYLRQYRFECFIYDEAFYPIINSDETDLSLEVAIEETLERKQPNFGNARWIEQFVNNGIIPAMADRIYSSGSTDLQRIEAADIAKAFEKFKPKANEPKPTRHRVKGFGA